MIGQYKLGIARGSLRFLVEESCGGKASNFQPGGGTGEFFGIEQQAILFQILQPHENIGVNYIKSEAWIDKEEREFDDGYQ